MTPRSLAVVATAGLLAFAQPAAACSMPSSYRPPSNLQLVDSAETIVLGVVEGGPDRLGDTFASNVIVRPTLLLKGDALPAEVRLGGMVRTDPRIVMTRSDPRELHAPNRDALRGACRRIIFERGMMLLLFLQRGDDGRLHLARHAFARTAEDVPSPDSLWVRATRLYGEIAALPAAERRAALIARRDSLRAAGGDPDAALLAADIDRQIERL
jgi:hypothetical protein